MQKGFRIPGWGKLLSEFKLQRAAALFRSRRGLCAAAMAVAAACLFASPAEAQVMDIASDGTVSVRQGAGAATWEVVTSPASDKMVDQNGQLDRPRLGLHQYHPAARAAAV